MLVLQDDIDYDNDEIEMTEIGGGTDEEPFSSDEREIVNHRPVASRQRCFGTAVASLLLAALVYFVAGAFLSPAFTTGETGVDEYDAGSGEVGIDANNAETQEQLDEELSATEGKKGHWGGGSHRPFAGKDNARMWWGKERHKGVNAGIARNKTYWQELAKKHSVIDRDKFKRLHQPGPDGMCTLLSGKKVPCAGGNRPSLPDQSNIEDTGKTVPVTRTPVPPTPVPPTPVPPTPVPPPKTSRQKVTLSDGKKFEVLEEMQHDPSSFTQGLTYANGMLFESAGLYGKSKVRQLNPKTGEVIKSINMDKKYFAEGMTYYDVDKLIQITWKSRKGFIYNATTLERISEFDFTTTLNEGWGITFDASDRTFIVSDGSEYLHFWDADNPGVDKKDRLKVIRQKSSTNAREMNELEFVDGKVIANVWYQDILLVINPVTGECEGEYDFSSLWPKNKRSRERADVLNGVSVSDEHGVLYVTGKLWKKMFKVRLQ